MKKDKVFFGITLIVGAIVLIINNLGYLPGVNAFSLIFTALLAGVMIKNLFRMHFAGTLFPLAIILIIYDEQLGITSITPWTVLIAAGLISFGLSMIFNKPSKWGYNINYNSYDKESYEFKTIDIEDESHIKLDTSFASSIKYINTDNFESADIRCRFAGMKIYFDNATLYNGKGVVRLDSSFSGVELYIPKTWTVEDKINTSFGGIDEKNRNQSDGQNTITLVGNVSFSGVEIFYI